MWLHKLSISAIFTQCIILQSQQHWIAGGIRMNSQLSRNKTFVIIMFKWYTRVLSTWYYHKTKLEPPQSTFRIRTYVSCMIRVHMMYVSSPRINTSTFKVTIIVFIARTTALYRLKSCFESHSELTSKSKLYIYLFI